MHALDQRHHHAWGDGMRSLVEQAPGQAGPRDAAIVVGTMGVKGWSYYMWSYQGRSNTWARGPIPPDRTLVGDPPQRSSVTAFLAAHRDAGHVFLMTMINAHRGWEPAIEGPLAAAGYRPVRRSGARPRRIARSSTDHAGPHADIAAGQHRSRCAQALESALALVPITPRLRA